MTKKLIFCIAIVFIIFSRGYAADKGIMAFCAAVTKPPMEEATEAFMRSYDIRVDLSFGGSGAMLSQIKLAKRGDIFIAASPDYMVKAERDRIIDLKGQRILAYLIPAINVQPGNPIGIKGLSDLTRPGVRVGICNPETAAIGLMGIEILEKNGLLKAVMKNVVTQAPNIGALESLLVMKRVDAIIGWGVLPNWNPGKLETIFLAPDQLPRLSYIPAAVTTFAENKDAATKFLDYLASAEGRKIFLKCGYAVTEEQVRKYAPKAKIGGEYTLPPDWAVK